MNVDYREIENPVFSEGEERKDTGIFPFGETRNALLPRKLKSPRLEGRADE